MYESCCILVCFFGGRNVHFWGEKTLFGWKGCKCHILSLSSFSPFLQSQSLLDPVMPWGKGTVLCTHIAVSPQTTYYVHEIHPIPQGAGRDSPVSCIGTQTSRSSEIGGILFLTFLHYKRGIFIHLYFLGIPLLQTRHEKTSDWWGDGKGEVAPPDAFFWSGRGSEFDPRVRFPHNIRASKRREGGKEWGILTAVKDHLRERGSLWPHFLRLLTPNCIVCTFFCSYVL